MARYTGRKSLEHIAASADGHGSKSLAKTLGPFSLIGLGIGCIIGAGIFVLTGKAAAQLRRARRSSLSFVLAGIACAFVGLCYAELAAMIPVAGSAYTYAYATVGEIFAWIIGWDLILEYAHGRRDRRGRLVGLCRSACSRNFGIHSRRNGLQATGEAVKLPDGTVGDGIVNLPAVLIVLAAHGAADARHPGIGTASTTSWSASSWSSSLIVIVRRRALRQPRELDALHSAEYRRRSASSAGAASCAAPSVVFFAYIGFDAVSTAAQEAKRPQRDMPIGILGSLIDLHHALRRGGARADRHRALTEARRRRPDRGGDRRHRRRPGCPCSSSSARSPG